MKGSSHDALAFFVFFFVFFVFIFYFLQKRSVRILLASEKSQRAALQSLPLVDSGSQFLDNFRDLMDNFYVTTFTISM